MHVRTKFPCRFRVLENVLVPLSDGCRLAARIWTPEDAEKRPRPAVLEYHPYRKRDGTAMRDDQGKPDADRVAHGDTPRDGAPKR